MIEHIITSSVLIVAILIISVLLEKKVNPCIKYALWLLVVVKLLVPLPEFESKISVMNVVSKIEESNDLYVLEDTDFVKTGERPGNTRIAVQNVSPISAHEKKSNNLDISKLCNGIWFVGGLLCAGVFVWSNLRFAGRLRKSRVLTCHYENKLNVYEVTENVSPCLFGFFKPCIYLQKNNDLSDEQKKYILVHEYTHYRHGDHIWAFIRCVCVILYWYNPLVWLAARVSIKDSELACDAGTLKVIGSENRIKYGEVLVEVAKGLSAKSTNIRILGCSTSATGNISAMKKRLQLIVKRPHTKKITLFVLFLLCVGIVGCTYGSTVVKEMDVIEPVEVTENERWNKNTDVTDNKNTAVKESGNDEEGYIAPDTHLELVEFEECAPYYTLSFQKVEGGTGKRLSLEEDHEMDDSGVWNPVDVSGEPDEALWGLSYGFEGDENAVDTISMNFWNRANAEAVVIEIDGLEYEVTFPKVEEKEIELNQYVTLNSKGEQALLESAIVYPKAILLKLSGIDENHWTDSFFLFYMEDDRGKNVEPARMDYRSDTDGLYLLYLFEEGIPDKELFFQVAEQTSKYAKDRVNHNHLLVLE